VFARSSEKGFRLVHFSVQGNHIHLIVEADDGIAFSRGIQRLLSRAAMMVNALLRRSGKLWRDRHHRRPIVGLSQMRNAYVYVIFNLRRHELESGSMSPGVMETLDACTSGAWFDGFSPEDPLPDGARERAGPPIVVRARSWLAASGWKRRGLIRFDELPR
jgi:hypothetical protein